MLRRQLFQRTVGVTAGASAILLSLSGSAAAAGATAKEKGACMAAYTAYKGALEREKAGHLRDARDMLLSCADMSACSGLAPKCRAKYTQLGTDMPSIVPLVADDSGTPRVDVEVKMDGQLLTSKLDGKGIPVEAGLHELSFSADGQVFATEKVMVVEGQRNRMVSVTLHTPGAVAKTTVAAPAPSRALLEPAPTPSKAEATDKAESEKSEEKPDQVATGPQTVESSHWGMPRSVVPYVLATVGLAGVGAGALLTFWGKKDNDQLRTDCGQTQSCAQSSLDHIRTLYLASDISIGAGVVALGVATWMFASSRSVEEKPAPRAAYHFDVQPTRTGAFASVSGSF